MALLFGEALFFGKRLAERAVYNSVTLANFDRKAVKNTTFLSKNNTTHAFRPN